MKLPWFMHLHNGVNTQVGVYATRIGVYVRSWSESTKTVEVTFYPLSSEFEFGQNRTVTKLGSFTDDATLTACVTQHLNQEKFKVGLS